ncbi:MAG TPA: glycosyltransferase [Tepidisphaeraceae bacterium]|nr:glycosyltransferase [Tepidisphaeraceae bacterium]
MNHRLVSIIIPCFNAEQFVGDAIRSALAQTYRPCEVIVIDDGSTDRSLEVIRSFGNEIKFESGPNRGGSAARNRALELAAGEFVQFLDADDLLHPDKLSRQVPHLISSPRSVICCNWELQDEDTEARRCRVLHGTQLDSLRFVVRNQLTICGPLHRKAELVAIGGFRECLPCCQEFDLHVRLAISGISWKHLNEALVTIRRRHRSVSSDLIRVLDQHEDICWNAYRSMERAGNLTQDRAAALAEQLARDARWYLERGHYDKSKHYFQQALLMHREGGLNATYRPHTRLLRRVLGPTITERLVAFKRGLI